jgi:hypothetical protein
MSCGCGKKKIGSSHFMGKDLNVDPAVWGPILWKYLHCITERMGVSGSVITDADQATYVENMLTTLHLIIPCTECQIHASEYIVSNPVPSLKGLKGEELRGTVRNWLFAFHNSVRSRKGQPIIIDTIDKCISLYSNCFIPLHEYHLFIHSVAYAVRQGWVRIDNWKKWFNTSEKIRIICGNIVI